MSTPVMVVPHPCQCYHGDKLRRFITVAPVEEVTDYAPFGEERTGAKDKFALLDLPISAEPDAPRKSHVANFGKLTTVGHKYLNVRNRVACLSHMGLGLLAKRLMQFQLRAPSELAQVMGFTHKQWNEAYVMQAWVRANASLKGYSAWMRTPTAIPGINEPAAPDEYVAGAPDLLLELIGKQTAAAGQ
ncbi:hypothetical protein ACFQO7_28185 [Catellatospora aurea]|uniref:Uncharacterized protein n=1 Tax=Catellatospora aurea TaxID=1337874 RepID=A0ABW2H2H6_9ACTN